MDRLASKVTGLSPLRLNTYLNSMDYNAHLDRWHASQQELAEQSAEQARAKQIALQVAFSEAEVIIQQIITPELQSLCSALANHGIQAKIVVAREASDLTPDSTFDVGIELREDIPADNPRLGIIFTAIPHGKFFTVKAITSRDRQCSPMRREIKFQDACPPTVQEACAAFLSAAFPLR